MYVSYMYREPFFGSKEYKRQTFKHIYEKASSAKAMSYHQEEGSKLRCEKSIGSRSCDSFPFPVDFPPLEFRCGVAQWLWEF